MTSAPSTLLRRELIGLVVEVIGSTNSALVGTKGTVVEESKSMLEIMTAGKTKKLPKKGTRFMFTMPDGTQMAVDGEKLSGRPEKRAKMKIKKW
jgi:ribonuclease P protein subunit POP4